MRTLVVITAGTLLGMAVGIVTGGPSSAGERLPSALSRAAHKSCDRLWCASLTWLRSPAMHVTGSAR